jgi:hypothetical protein
MTWSLFQLKRSGMEYCFEKIKPENKLAYNRSGNACAGRNSFTRYTGV